MPSDFAVFPLSFAPKSHLTAKLSLALRAARGEIRCPSEAYVRAGNCVEGFRSPRNPSNPPHKVAGNLIPGGGASLAGLAVRERYKQYRAFGAIADLIHHYVVPLPLRGEGLNAAKRERYYNCRARHFR